MAQQAWIANHAPHLHQNGALAVTSFGARKPLLQRSWRAKQQPAFCACGQRLHRQQSTEFRSPVAAASAAVDAPVKSNLRKRKQQSEALLVVEGLSKTHDGQRYLFENVDFTVKRGDRLALVGPNGAGKSSLFKLLSDEDQPDAGAVKRRKGLTIGFLSQDPQLDDRSTIMDAVLQSGSSVSQAVQRYEAALAASGTSQDDSKQQQVLNQSLHEINALNGWGVKADAQDILSNLGLPDPTCLVGGLSGGQRRRVALAAALLAAPDLLILDEPTNHMDLGAIHWMEKRLTQNETTLILVTHDRAFMEAVCTGILELDQGIIHTHSFGGAGSYDRFRQVRAERHAAQAAVAATAKVQLKKESEWMRRQPKARATKAKFRQDAFHELVQVSRGGPKQDTRADFGAGHMARQGKKVLVLEDAACSAGLRNIIRGFWYDFAPGERIGIVGPNGAGKSSLLDMITGDRQLDQGSRDVGETTFLGYFRQHVDGVRPELRIVDYIREVADESKTATDSTSLVSEPEVMLERLGFARPRQQQLVNSLSGGERRRLQLAAVLIRKPNLLILDEPTNDLDLQTVEVLEELLADYKGCLLVVSHDRTFMEHLADRLFVVTGDGLIRMYDGLYSEYLATLDEMEDLSKATAQHIASASSSQDLVDVPSSKHSTRQSSSVATSPSVATKQQKPQKMGYREKQEFERLEIDIDQLTADKDSLEEQISQNAAAAGHYSEVLQMSQTLAKLATEIEAKTERWLELSDIADAQ